MVGLVRRRVPTPQGLRNLTGRVAGQGFPPATDSTWSRPHRPPRKVVNCGPRATPASLKGPLSRSTGLPKTDVGPPSPAPDAIGRSHVGPRGRTTSARYSTPRIARLFGRRFPLRRDSD